MNPKLNALLDHYSESHQNPRNQRIHKAAVPLIMFSLLGLLSQISLVPEYGLNGAWIAIILATVYYFQFRSVQVYVILFLQVIPMMILIYLNPFPPVPLFLGLFVLAWIAQFIGHKIEGKKPSFFEDLQYLLIGPLWILKNFWAKP